MPRFVVFFLTAKIQISDAQGRKKRNVIRQDTEFALHTRHAHIRHGLARHRPIRRHDLQVERCIHIRLLTQSYGERTI